MNGSSAFPANFLKTFKAKSKPKNGVTKPVHFGSGDARHQLAPKHRLGRFIDLLDNQRRVWNTGAAA
jgi:hypothetical protein